MYHPYHLTAASGNQYSDLDFPSFNKKLLMQRDVIGNPPVSRQALQAAGPRSGRRALLSADRDWRALGKVSGVRNQVNIATSQYIIGLNKI